MFNKNWLMVPAVVSWALVGCTKLTPAQVALNNVAQGNIDKSSRPACEIQKTEYALDAKMVSFELTDSGGINVGFSLLSGFLKLLSVDFQATSGKLTVGMALFDPMVPKTELLNVTGGGTSFSFDASVDAGFQNIAAGFAYNHTTPLSQLAQQTLADTFTNLTTQMNSLQSSWRTEVLALVPGGNQFVIPAGSYSNIKLGDVFAIYNVIHEWDGTPCASNHIIARRTTATPLALARVDQIENNGAVLTMICSEQNPCNHTETVAIGAVVEISKLTDPARTLYRSMEIRDVTGAVIQYEQSKSVDLGPYLKDQINAAAHDFGFIVTTP